MSRAPLSRFHVSLSEDLQVVFNQSSFKEGPSLPCSKTCLAMLLGLLYVVHTYHLHEANLHCIRLSGIPQSRVRLWGPSQNLFTPSQRGCLYVVVLGYPLFSQAMASPRPEGDRDASHGPRMHTCKATSP